MQLSASFLVILATGFQLGVFPTFAATAAPDARDTLTMFRDINLGGPSYTSENPADFPCIQVPFELRNDVSSLIVGANIACTMFFNAECVGAAGPTYRGSSGNGGPAIFNTLAPFNRRAASFRCVR
ncbi:hypothetical protein BD779DRAFT_239393 [Infundibulicybe gibba]|nr:hypothetical protein BD779DRAFT_239393 [Infundibulicybe gibba]